MMHKTGQEATYIPARLASKTFIVHIKNRKYMPIYLYIPLFISGQTVYTLYIYNYRIHTCLHTYLYIIAGENGLMGFQMAHLALFI